MGGGFYMGIREVGEVFHIPADFDAPWFVRDVIVVAAPPDVTLEQLTDILPGEPQSETPEEAPLEEPQPDADNKPRKPNKQENLK